MDISAFNRYALCSCVAAAMLTGCGGSQLPVGAPGTTLVSNAQHLGASGYELLYSFRGGSDGEYPGAGLVVDGGVLYGMTVGNCGYSCAPGSAGTVFDVSTSGQEKVLYSFKGAPDATNPTAALLDVNGTLFGTTQSGGTYKYGTVFAVTTTGDERVLYSFKGGRDGSDPWASLVDLNGLLYGTTALGGVSRSNCLATTCGTIFDISPSGIKKVLYRFKGSPHDGSYPISAMVALNGALYGTTWIGGSGKCYQGCGTVFEVSTAGTERVLYSFKGAPDGANPDGALVVVKGLLYGTTATGGTSKACGSADGCGTFFSISTSGKEHVIYSFKGGKDVSGPGSGLVPFNGLLYGTAPGFCATCGTAFDVSTSGQEHVLHRFTGGKDGQSPDGGLTLKKGILYGTTAEGGMNNFGTVFKLTP